MNRYVFGYRGAPITHVTVTIASGEMRMTGRLHKGVNIPFDIRARVDATPPETAGVATIASGPQSDNAGD
jgi:hypothetical protein